MSEHDGPQDADKNHRTLQKRLYANAAKLFSGTTVASFIALGSFVLVARGLGAEKFGALVLVFTYVEVIIRVCGFQSWQALIRFASRYKSENRLGHVDAVFRFGFYADFIACLTAAILAMSLASIAGDVFAWRQEVEDAARLFALVAPFSLTGTPFAVLRFYDRFDRIAWQQIVAAIFKLACVALVYLLAPTFENFLYAWMGAHLFTHLLLIGMSWRTYTAHRQSSVDSTTISVREVASFSMLRFLFVSNLDGTLRVARELDAQVVALFIDESAAGVLRVARRLAAFVGRLVDAFFTAIYPELANLAALGKWHELRRFVRSSSLQVGFVATLPLIGFVLLGEFLLTLVFGAEYSNAYTVTIILLAAMVIWGFAQPYAPAVLALGQPTRLLLVHTFATCVYMALLFALVPKLSIIGAGLALCALYLVWGLLVFYAYQKQVPRVSLAQND